MYMYEYVRYIDGKIFLDMGSFMIPISEQTALLLAAQYRWLESHRKEGLNFAQLFGW